MMRLAMTVKELIELLQDEPPDRKVVVPSGHLEDEDEAQSVFVDHWYRIDEDVVKIRA